MLRVEDELDDKTKRSDDVAIPSMMTLTIQKKGQVCKTIKKG